MASFVFVMFGIFGFECIWTQWGKDIENFSSSWVNNNFPLCLTKKFFVFLTKLVGLYLIFICKGILLVSILCFPEKHGPCSSPVIRDEYDYFDTALNLYFKHNVTVRKCFFIPLFLFVHICHFELLV